MNIEEAKIIIPGLKKKYIFYHLSDAHISYVPDGASEEQVIRAQNSAKWWGKWCDPKFGTEPIHVFEKFMDILKDSDADVILFTGDTMEGYADYHVEYLKRKFKECGKEVLYVPGNHEVHSFEYPEKLREITFGDPEIWVRDFGEFVVIGLDNNRKEISDRQFAVLNEQIARGIPIILQMHIPLATEASEEIYKGREHKMEGHLTEKEYYLMGLESTPESGKRFSSLVKDENSHIAAIIAGHTHRSHFGEFLPGKMQFIAAPLFKNYVRRIEISGE